MPINPQTSGFPPIYHPEQSWSLDLRKLSELIYPGSGVRQGLEMGIPLSAGQPTTGLMPTMTDGAIVIGDQVLGVYGSRVVAAAPRNVTNRRIFFGLDGYYYAGVTNAPTKPNDALIGEITTDNAGTASIISIAQPLSYGGGRFGVRALVSLAVAVDGGDRNLFTWTVPSNLGLRNVRLAYGQIRVVTAATAAATGDDFVLKLQVDGGSAVTLGTAAAAGLGSAGTVVRVTADDADAYSWNSASNFVLQYNQTDAAPAITGGLVEVHLVFEAF